jgi:hypothetical protein
MIKERRATEASQAHFASFLDYHHKWQRGDLSLFDVLKIPRVPERIGILPNPEAFSNIPPEFLSDGILNDRPCPTTLSKRIRFGNHPTLRFNKAIESALLPAIEMMAIHALSTDIDLRHTRITVGGVRSPLNDDRLPTNIHLDYAGTRQPSRLEYIVSDYQPTEFYCGSFDISEEAKKISEQSPLLEDYRHEAHVFQARPYEIVAYNPTMPHATPQNPDDDTPRTLTRVIFEQL